MPMNATPRSVSMRGICSKVDIREINGIEETLLFVETEFRLCSTLFLRLRLPVPIVSRIVKIPRDDNGDDDNENVFRENVKDTCNTCTRQLMFYV